MSEYQFKLLVLGIIAIIFLVTIGILNSNPRIKTLEATINPSTSELQIKSTYETQEKEPLKPLSNNNSYLV